jgi:hypothetical protein
MNRSVWIALFSAAAAVSICAAQQAPPGERRVPSAPAATAKEKVFHDPRYAVSFRVPPGWDLTRTDGEVSTFHTDARSAPPGTMLRGVATIAFNPYPTATFAGAMFYFSVEPRATQAECSRQTTVTLANGKQEGRPVEQIAGVPFAHGHDEYGDICVESRDDVYTTYRKGACYRFDLTLNTFCSVSSGVRDMSPREMLNVQSKLTGILSSVRLEWDKPAQHVAP